MKKKYQQTILLTSVLLLLAVVSTYFILPVGFTPTLLPVALVLFGVTSFFSFSIFEKILGHSPQQFINYFIAFTFMKMLAQLLVLVVLILIARSQAVALILWYCVFFAIYFTIETLFALKLSRKN